MRICSHIHVTVSISTATCKQRYTLKQLVTNTTRTCSISSQRTHSRIPEELSENNEGCSSHVEAGTGGGDGEERDTNTVVVVKLSAEIVALLRRRLPVNAYIATTFLTTEHKLACFDRSKMDLEKHFFHFNVNTTVTYDLIQVEKWKMNKALPWRYILLRLPSSRGDVQTVETCGHFQLDLPHIPYTLRGPL